MPKYLSIALSIAALVFFSGVERAYSDEIEPDEVPVEVVPKEEKPAPVETSEPVADEPKPDPWTPFQLAFFNPLQIFVEDYDVAGLRINAVYGYNVKITGLDLGAIGVSDTMTGLQINMAFSSPRNLNGIQISALNEVTGRARGLQVGGVFSHAEEIYGMQIAGTHNRAEIVKGVQIGGMVNEAEELTGLQLGVINCNWGRAFPFQCLPIMSFGFGPTDDEEDE